MTCAWEPPDSRDTGEEHHGLAAGESPSGPGKARSARPKGAETRFGRLARAGALQARQHGPDEGGLQGAADRPRASLAAAAGHDHIARRHTEGGLSTNAPPGLSASEPPFQAGAGGAHQPELLVRTTLGERHDMVWHVGLANDASACRVTAERVRPGGDANAARLRDVREVLRFYRIPLDG